MPLRAFSVVIVAPEHSEGSLWWRGMHRCGQNQKCEQVTHRWEFVEFLYASRGSRGYRWQFRVAETVD